MLFKSNATKINTLHIAQSYVKNLRWLLIDLSYDAQSSIITLDSSLVLRSLLGDAPGSGVLPSEGHVGMCGPKGFFILLDQKFDLICFK